ncbi:glutaredoxin family protein [Mycobacteroides abscessus]|uniref:glutaredoxin family protein n=1 Tax=Mycobacteroides abscessus TaxID=36809 RepID=UPI0009A86078|nr:glutaredoxin family protein [Mycobacteroides abscessus]SLH38609.1 ribonucleoside-diphosphate reductase class Ib glutaredoxin subunit [Mycobacteroides abscessus subsp. massiliense]
MHNPFHRNPTRPHLPRPDGDHGKCVPLVYVQSGIPDCQKTVRAFRAAGADIEVVDISMDAMAKHDLKACGYQQLPVVNTGDAIWAGHRPTQIQQYAEAISDTERAL